MTGAAFGFKKGFHESFKGMNEVLQKSNESLVEAQQELWYNILTFWRHVFGDNGLRSVVEIWKLISSDTRNMFSLSWDRFFGCRGLFSCHWHISPSWEVFVACQLLHRSFWISRWSDEMIGLWVSRAQIHCKGELLWTFFGTISDVQALYLLLFLFEIPICNSSTSWVGEKVSCGV